MKRVCCVCNLYQNSWDSGKKSKKQRHVFFFDIKQKESLDFDDKSGFKSSVKYWKEKKG